MGIFEAETMPYPLLLTSEEWEADILSMKTCINCLRVSEGLHQISSIYQIYTL